MSLAAEFDNRSDRYAYAVVSAGAAALSYDHARAFFRPFMGDLGASVTPLMLDAVAYWLASACIRQARAGRPLPMLRFGAYTVIALAITANALGGATVAERVFMALPAALFGFLTEARIRLALYHHRAEHGDERLRARLWVRHPARAFRAWLWLARQSAPAFDRASAERDRLAAARDAMRLALPGHSRAIRRARAGVLRELNAGRLSPAAAVKASGLMDKPGVPDLHRAALAAALGARPPAITADTAADYGADIKRTRRRTSRTGTATAIARLRDRHPDMTTADIAARLGITDRTVRRHLSARTTTGTPPAAAGITGKP
jgi:DNA-binding transcriptional ArsR family regulator